MAVPVWVCLLRAVNLGKQRKLPMATSRTALTNAAMTNVRTYLQSGNIVAQSPLRSPGRVSHLVRTVIGSEFALDVPVITRRPVEIDDVIASNPFSAEADQRAHLVRVIFLAEIPSADRVSQMEAHSELRQTCRVVGGHVYVDYVRGYHGTGRTATYHGRPWRRWHGTELAHCACTLGPVREGAGHPTLRGTM